MKPPVDAPTSTARRPRTSSPNASSPAASLCPPRDTYVSPSAATTLTDSSALDLARRRVARRAADEHPARFDRLDRARPARDEAAPHELGIEPPPHDAGSITPAFARRPSAGLLGRGLLLCRLASPSSPPSSSRAPVLPLRGRLGQPAFEAREVGLGREPERRSAAAATSFCTILRRSSVRRRLSSTISSTAARHLIAGELPLRHEVGGDGTRLRAAHLGELHPCLEGALPVGSRRHRFSLRPQSRPGVASPFPTTRQRSRPRSAPTNAGRGSGTGSSPGAADHAAEDERERPSERGRERAVGRRPVADHDALVAEAGADERDHRRLRLPGDLGRTAARRSPPRRRSRPRRAAVRRRRIGRVEVGRDEAAHRRAPRRRRGEPFEVERRGASRRRPRRPAARSTAWKPQPSSASTTPAPAQASTRAPGGSCSATSAAAACALEPTSSPIGLDTGGAEPLDVVGDRPLELFVRNTTRAPGFAQCRDRRRASPGSASSPRQITPSRSQQTTGALTVVSGSAASASAAW